MEKTINTDNAACGFTDISGVKANSACAAPEQRVEESRRVADDGKDGREFSALKKDAERDFVGETKPIQSNEADAEERLADSSAEARECVNSAGELSEAEKEDKEFLALIKGRYREAYKRRTESIIRKRLKSSKVKNEQSAAVEKSISAGMVKDTASASFEVNADSGSEAKEFGTDTVGAKKTAVLDMLYGTVTEKIPHEELKRTDFSIQKNINRSRPRENGLGGSVGMITGINVSALKGSDVLELLRRAEAGEKIKFK